MKVEKKYLVFRNEARVILKVAKRKSTQNKLPNITIDFSEADFMSRSFIDELLNAIGELKQEKFDVRIINIKPNLAKLIKKIKETKERIKQEIVKV